MNTRLSTTYSRAVNTVKRLRLDCRIDGVTDGWDAQLLRITGQGTVASIVQLAEALQADILPQLPDASRDTPDWLNFELCVASDDTDFDHREG